MDWSLAGYIVDLNFAKNAAKPHMRYSFNTGGEIEACLGYEKKNWTNNIGEFINTSPEDVMELQ